jgi:hypothetical protein
MCQTVKKFGKHFTFTFFTFQKLKLIFYCDNKCASVKNEPSTNIVWPCTFLKNRFLQHTKKNLCPGVMEGAEGVPPCMIFFSFSVLALDKPNL